MMRCFSDVLKKTLPPDVFGDVLEKIKHRTNDASNDVSRPALPGQSPSADLDLDLDLDLDQSREVVDVRESLFDFDPPASNLRFSNQTINEGRCC